MVYVDPEPTTAQQLSARTWRQWMPRFLEALYEADGHIQRAAKAVAPSRATIYTHKAKCPLFSDLWDWVLTFKGVEDRRDWGEVFPDRLPPAFADQVRTTAKPSPAAEPSPAPVPTDGQNTGNGNPFNCLQAPIW